jgi:5-methylphenazine-1-carboxylate 1-monooxygenase
VAETLELPFGKEVGDAGFDLAPRRRGAATVNDMRIAIIGGGIGGSALALSLHANGLRDIEVFESSSAFAELGVGINVLPHAMRELTELGVLDDLASRGVHTSSLSYYNRFGQLIWTEPRGIAAGYRWPQLSIHRGELFGVLARAAQQRIGADRFHVGRRIDDPVRLASEFDVVVACDGIHSATRTWMYPDEGPPLWNGVTMWRGTTEMEPFGDGRSMVMAGRLWQRMVIYPIRDLDGGRQLVNWVAEVRNGDGQPMPKQDWNAAVPVSEPLHHFESFDFEWLDVPTMIRAADQVLAYPMADRDPLPAWRRGNITLLGDAAHPMYPVGSNGSSQAIIDARILARELATQPTIGAALDAYEALRRPATASIVLANRKAGPEESMEIVAERAPDGFDRLDDVISHDELVAISAKYKTLAGFDPALLNDRESWSVAS